MRYVIDMHVRVNVQDLHVTRRSTKKSELTALVQVKISRRAALLLRKRAKRELRTQASYLRAIIYRDLGLLESRDQGA